MRQRNLTIHRLSTDDMRELADRLYARTVGLIFIPEKVLVWLVGIGGAVIPLGILIGVYLLTGGTIW